MFPPDERFRMSEQVLEQFTRAYIHSQPPSVKEITFAWQGGEPTLMGVDFFRRAVAFQKKFSDGRRIRNAFQTNGTRLDREWAEFFKENNFLVGVSIDGPEQIHDAYRVKRGGGGSFQDVMKGIAILQECGVEWNSLTCVNRINAAKGEQVYRFLKGIGSRYIQFIPIVERRPNSTARDAKLWLAAPDPGGEVDQAPVTPWSVRSVEFGRFLVDVFNRWVRHDVGKYFIQAFDGALAKWLGASGGICVHAESCGDALAMEHDGSIYACDHYVYPGFRRGSIDASWLADMVDSPEQRSFGAEKRTLLPEKCKQCPFLFACNGGCPKHRFVETESGGFPLNYLCEGYRRFFGHIDPYMRVMAHLYSTGRAPADIMKLVRGGSLPFASRN